MYKGAIYAELDKARAQTAALADCLDGIGSPGRGPIEQDTLRGLSLFAWHIVQDISAVQREIQEA